MIAVQQFADAAAAAYGACADAPLLDLLDQRNRQRLKKVPSACARGSRVIARNGEIAMKLIDVAPAARVIIAAMICVVAGSANAQGKVLNQTVFACGLPDDLETHGSLMIQMNTLQIAKGQPVMA